MINKKSIWFLTLFSLILVLSVYYVTMPNELVLPTTKTNEPVVSVEESELLASLRLESDIELDEQLQVLEGILTNSNTNIEEKNNAFDQIKNINSNKAKEQKLEQIIKETFNLKTFIKIESDQVKIIVDSKEHDNKIANDIMKKVRENFDERMYITIKFQK